MPPAEIKYSADMRIDGAPILRGIEETILSLDAGAGHCKGRAYPADVFQHTHILVEVSLLTKPHRDAAFLARLIERLEAAIKRHLAQPCEFSLKVLFAPPIYITHPFEPER